MRGLPEPIQEVVDTLAMFDDRADKIQALISIGDRFVAVPESVASRPFSEDHRVPGCESQVFVWGTPAGAGWHFEFAVENPQGLSAMAMAVILQEGLEGLTADQISAVPDEVVYEIFGRELSMGKSMGLMNMLQMCKRLSRA